ncbi:hypothetical protein DFH06DRAFT_1142443 [Mycena polygramma]|nr:hypothetical protein DFH06DRAFT_1142443 [Mycena polygramma]
MASGYLAFAGLILPPPRHKHISATLANPRSVGFPASPSTGESIYRGGQDMRWYILSCEYRTVRSLEKLVTFHTAGEQRKQPAGGKAQTSDTILEGIERKATHMRESGPAPGAAPQYRSGAGDNVAAVRGDEKQWRGDHTRRRGDVVLGCGGATKDHWPWVPFSSPHLSSQGIIPTRVFLCLAEVSGGFFVAGLRPITSQTEIGKKKHKNLPICVAHGSEPEAPGSGFDSLCPTVQACFQFCAQTDSPSFQPESIYSHVCCPGSARKKGEGKGKKKKGKKNISQ